MARPGRTESRAGGRIRGRPVNGHWLASVGGLGTEVPKTVTVVLCDVGDGSSRFASSPSMGRWPSPFRSRQPRMRRRRSIQTLQQISAPSPRSAAAGFPFSL
jgi:hypothetical protein